MWEDRSGAAAALVQPLAGPAAKGVGSDVEAEEAGGSEADGADSDGEYRDGARELAVGAEQLQTSAGSQPTGPAASEAAADDEPGAEPSGLQGAWEDRRGAGAGGAGPPAARRRPVWEDPDDARQAVNVAGRSRLRKLRAAEEERVLTGVHTRIMPPSVVSLRGLTKPRMHIQSMCLHTEATRWHRMAWSEQHLWFPTDRRVASPRCHAVRLPPARLSARLPEQPQAFCAGTEYEARLRQQHAKLNPRTGWATAGGALRRRRRGFGGDSDSDEECAAGPAVQSPHMAREARVYDKSGYCA